MVDQETLSIAEIDDIMLLLADFCNNRVRHWLMYLVQKKRRPWVNKLLLCRNQKPLVFTVLPEHNEKLGAFQTLVVLGFPKLKRSLWIDWGDGKSTFLYRKATQAIHHYVLDFDQPAYPNTFVVTIHPSCSGECIAGDFEACKHGSLIPEWQWLRTFRLIKGKFDDIQSMGTLGITSLL